MNEWKRPPRNFAGQYIYKSYCIFSNSEKEQPNLNLLFTSWQELDKNLAY